MRCQVRKTFFVIFIISLLLYLSVLSSWKARFYSGIEGNLRGLRLLQTQCDYLSTNKLMTMINETLIRCRAKSLGCFVPFDKPTATYRQLALSSITRTEMKQECLRLCFNSGGDHAGLAIYTKACICNKGINGLISDVKLKEWAEKRWYLANNCRNIASYEIFRKLGNCEGNTTTYAENALIGWTRLQIGERTDEMLLFRSSKVTTNQCILNCESRDFMIAMPYLNEQRCICSDYESVFAKNGLATFGSNQTFSPEYNIPVYRTVHEDPACSIRFGDLTTGGPIALASQAGSGNTWIRHLLEISTGVYTESYDMDRVLYHGGLFGELTLKKMSKSVPVKEHALNIWPRFHSAIAVVRNPRKAFVAEWSRRRTRGNHTGVPSMQAFRGPDFTKYVLTRAIDEWTQRIKVVVTHKWKAVIVYYENLCENPAREMRRIAEALDLNNTDHKQNFEKRLICMQLDVTGNFKRPSRKLDFDPFTEESHVAITNALMKINQTIKEFHFPPLPSSYLSRDL